MTYLYDLPLIDRNKLVAVLSIDQTWLKLATLLSLTPEDIYKLRMSESPADALLTSWGQRNHSVKDLFLRLRQLKLFHAMDIIKHHVDKKYHRFILKSGGFDLNSKKNNMVISKNATGYNEKYGVNMEIGHSHVSKFIEKDLKLNLNDISICDNGQALSVKILNTEETSKTKFEPSPYPANFSPQRNITSLLRSASSQCGFFLRNVPYSELTVACNEWNISNLIGRGGFGQVFKGKWRGQGIAVKRINIRICDNDDKFDGLSVSKKCINQLIAELQSLHQFPAENLLQILAYSFSDENSVSVLNQTPPCLVYQLMPNGSVNDRLKLRQNTKPLTWIQRSNIALGTARGLVYVHSNNIIHGDIKSANILLDKNFEAKIGDFGLARSGSVDTEQCSFRIVTSIQGTESFLPDDYVRSKQLSAAVDVFCYGMFLFELVTGKSPWWKYPNSGKIMRDVMTAASDPGQYFDENAGSISNWTHVLFFLGKDCTQSLRTQRPKMALVLNTLETLWKDRHKIESVKCVSDEETSSAPANNTKGFLPLFLDENQASLSSSIQSLTQHSSGTQSTINELIYNNDSDLLTSTANCCTQNSEKITEHDKNEKQRDKISLVDRLSVIEASSNATAEAFKNILES